MHPKAHKWFRIDIADSKINEKKIFSEIAGYSFSQELLGYPLPLIDAHQGCLSVHKMKEDYLNILVQVAKKIGITFDELVNGFTNFEGRSEGDVHTLLDKITL